MTGVLKWGQFPHREHAQKERYMKKVHEDQSVTSTSQGLPRTASKPGRALSQPPEATSPGDPLALDFGLQHCETVKFCC